MGTTKKDILMKTTLFTLVSCLMLGAAPASQEFIGVITDSMCGTKHTMMKGQPDAECIKMCAKGSSEYALYDGARVWKLSDQKTPAKFAAGKVVVTGTADEKTMTIKVASITAAR
jgi:hypothetical protein